MTVLIPPSHIFFFFNDTATTEIYTLSLHDALPICGGAPSSSRQRPLLPCSLSLESATLLHGLPSAGNKRSEEHTSELQSQSNLVCRLLLEKKKKQHHPCVHYWSQSQTHSLTFRCCR